MYYNYSNGLGKEARAELDNRLGEQHAKLNTNANAAMGFYSGMSSNESRYVITNYLSDDGDVVGGVFRE